MKGLWERTPNKDSLTEGCKGFSSKECSGPGGTGLAVAVLGGTGGHSPPSGLAGEVSVGAPRED